MHKIKLIALLLMSTAAYCDGNDWLWEKSAVPLDIELNSTRVIIVCAPSTGCQPVIIYGD